MEQGHAAGGARIGAQVEFRHVSKHYGSADGQAAVDDLSLVADQGDICVLVGPSGCGKTTTLKMVNRLVEPTSGQVLIDGRDVAEGDVVALRRTVGYVIQQIGLFPHQTVAENVATVPRLLGWPRDRIQRRIEELLDLVGLDAPGMRERYPAQLSGGERQRVGVARAMAVEPPVMLMDEPFGAVDPIVREHLQDAFLRIQRQLGTTVLFVTHDINEAIKMGTKVAVFEQGGRLAQYSPPVELLTRPANEYVARFVGADRALKSLALLRVGIVGLAPMGPVPPRVQVSPETNLRDALSLLLASGEREAAVVAGDQPQGVLNLETLAGALQEAAARLGLEREGEAEPPGQAGPGAGGEAQAPGQAGPGAGGEAQAPGQAGPGAGGEAQAPGPLLAVGPADPLPPPVVGEGQREGER